jgi:hypothetical protein
VPYVYTLIIGKFGMVYQQFVSEYEPQPCGKLGCQAYFRHKKQYLVAVFETVGYEM